MSARLQVDKYFAALERLKGRGTRISNDAVALEAGSGRGSIKPSRLAYKPLIEAIESARREQLERSAVADPMPALRQDKQRLQRLLDEALEREVCLLHEVYDLREELRQIVERSRRPGKST